MITAADIASARDTILSSDATDMAASLAALNRCIDRVRIDETLRAWSDGRKGAGLAKAEGYTETETGVLRRLYACSMVRHADVAELSRTICALRRKLPASVVIATVHGQGYRLEQGDAIVFRLLGGPQGSAKVATFTEKQTAIMQLFAERGALHREQFKCLGRHVSNIRKGLDPYAIRIETAGEGLYTVSKRDRAALKKLLAGELQPAPHEIVRKRPHLALVAA